MLRAAPFLIVLALQVYCVISVITSRDDEARHLPRIGWMLLVLLFPLIGSIAWLAAGRAQTAARRPSAYERPASAYPEYDRPGRAAGVSPESDEEFLRKVRERAEEQRRRYREQQADGRSATEEPGDPDTGS